MIRWKWIYIYIYILEYFALIELPRIRVRDLGPELIRNERKLSQTKNGPGPMGPYGPISQARCPRPILIQIGPILVLCWYYVGIRVVLCWY